MKQWILGDLWDLLVKGNLDSWMPREERQRNCRNAPLRALLAPQAGDCVIVRVDLSRQGRQRGLHFGGEIFGSCRCENLRESESYWLWAWTGLRIFQMCVGDLRSTKSGVFLKCTRTRLNSIQGWTVSKASFHYQGDYQELLGCLLCASFQDLAMRHLVPALGRYDCALDYWCTLSLVSSTELLLWRTVLLQDTTSLEATTKSVRLSWPGACQVVTGCHRMSQEDWAACRWVLWEFRCEFCKFPKVICSFLFRHWISLSAPPHAVQLLVAVVPYLGHNSAYVRGSQHSVVVGFCARIT